MAPVDGFVHIIESPSSNDLLEGCTEGKVLSESLRLARIPYCYSLVVDRPAFGQALSTRLVDASKHFQRYPILHLSMHGNASGVALTSNEFLSWDELQRLLLPLARAMQGGLLVCMSSCFGGAGCRMAMNDDKEPTFWALVGNRASPEWADAAIAYASFYHLFFKNLPIETCVDSMKVASGDHNFTLHVGAEIKGIWQDFVARFDRQIGTHIQNIT